MKFLLSVSLILSTVTQGVTAQLGLRGQQPGESSTNAVDWKVGYEAYRQKVDPDNLGFVVKLHSEGTRHAERGADYGLMCRGKECEKDDWLVTNHVSILY